MNSALSAERTVPTLSVVICAYTLDRWEDLRAAIGSVLVQDPPADEVVLVVDHNQALLERAERELSGVHVVPNQRRRGLSGAATPECRCRGPTWSPSSTTTPPRNRDGRAVCWRPTATPAWWASAGSSGRGGRRRAPCGSP